MLVSVVFTLLFGIYGVYSLDCRTIEKGDHFISTLPYYGLNKDLIASTRIKFDNNTVRYLFPLTNNKGRECTQSWNQVCGTTRCGYFNSNHQDADRFVWRCAGSCLIYDTTGHVIGEKTNYSEANLVELAASTYDDGLKPYEHPGTLQKEFTIKLEINTWYRLTLILSETITTYQLFDNTDLILETQTINHRSCSEFDHGMKQGFYFGGECPTPQAISVYYD
jgi:hypothetical protein